MVGVYAGYVEQFDTLLPELTVTEMLMYTAELKRKRREPLAVRPGVFLHFCPLVTSLAKYYTVRHRAGIQSLIVCLFSE